MESIFEMKEIRISVVSTKHSNFFSVTPNGAYKNNLY